jgi:predicted nucleotidyltransferase
MEYHLKNIEIDNDIKIIYAVLAGSRAWNLNSEFSDYDIRFVYKQNNYKNYIILKPEKEVIEGKSKDLKYEWQGNYFVILHKIFFKFAHV